MKKPKTKPAAKPRIGARHLKLLWSGIQIAVPFMLNEDKVYRGEIIRHLLDSHRAEVLSQIAAGVRRLGGKHA
jgi:hypothetical protein